MHLSHEPYYTDRRTESDLCYDFPADEPLIDGLHAMQVHFYNQGTNIEIPVLRVMNTAHFLAAYMFNTSCSGDQLEYDVMAYSCMGHDMRNAMLTMVVLAAMLRRTEGFRAKQCRNVLLEDRSEDFNEGLSLYERFISSIETRFREEDFHIDIMQEVSTLREENAQLKQQLKHKTMSEYNQYNIGTQNNYNAPVTITNITNNYTHPQPTQQETKARHEPEDIKPMDTSFFGTDRFAEDVCEKNLREAIDGAKSKADACRRIMLADTCGYIHLKQFTDERKAELINPFAMPRYAFSGDDFKKARNRPTN